MMGHRRAAATAGLGIIGVVSLSPAGAAREVAACPGVPSSPTTTAVVASVSAPTTPVDLVVPAPGSGASDTSASQSITVSVLPGPLSLLTERAVIELHAVGGQVLCGRLPPVRVIDARGSGAGWRVRWSVESITADGRPIPRSAVEVIPDPPSVVYGLPTGLVAGGGTGADRRVLFRAEPGTGGGTSEAGASVEARLSRGRTLPTTAHVVLRFVLVPEG
jgi:hypothetical protein